MIVEYKLSFKDYLDARDEKDVVPNYPKSLDLARMFILLLGGVVLITWNPISAAIGSGLLLILAAIVADHFLKRRAIKARNNELHNDFERFSSGNYTFEADRNGWRLYSEREEQAHAWEELFMIKESSRILYLVTYSGACTLPKAAFTPEQLSELKTWCE